MNKPITIVGGGLAGLSLGIGLRHKEVPVTLYERGVYPRHKVCGEFISGAGREVLRRLGLESALNALGAVEAYSARFFLRNYALPVRRLPEPALCISRYDLDSMLADEFVRSGGQLQQGRISNEKPGPGVVLATGRRAEANPDGWHWFGLKMHARSLPLDADLEMHWQPDGYVGVCRLPRDEINVCGLFRKKNGPHTSQNWRALLRGAPGTELHSRLLKAEWDTSSFCAVAGLGFMRALPTVRECRLGDRLTMTAPITGNGMSMALEAAELALEPLSAYSLGALEWDAAVRQIGAHCRRAFARRLRWAARLQQLIFLPGTGGPPFSWLLRSGVVWRTMFALTRN